LLSYRFLAVQDSLAVWDTDVMEDDMMGDGSPEVTRKKKEISPSSKVDGSWSTKLT
jgi:hypothetical protein